MPTIRLQEAKNYAREGSAEDALRALDPFADTLDDTCTAMSSPANPRIFDKVQNMLWAEADEAVDGARTEAVAELRAAYVAALETEEVWATVRSDERFAQIIARVSCYEGGVAA